MCPRRQCGLGRRRIILDAIDRLPAQVSGLRDLDDVGVLAEHILDDFQLGVSEARLATVAGLLTFLSPSALMAEGRGGRLQ